MANERRRAVRRVFMEVADLRSDERVTALAEACGDDAALRSEVEALLEAEARAGGFMGDPTDGAAGAPDAVATVTGAPRERPGEQIDGYKLLQEIGEGGFGTVWAAEQREPVKRRVALKIIKLGMDTKQVIARFEAERQALAMMDHPNIAKVLDAGATETGRPYFVMELVQGVSITEHCDENNLSVHERLDLFKLVCSAVQHAHQKGIIHRDLKPSNVLVTMHDDTAVPKVIDFGIAKATSAKLTERTLFTEHRQFVGTPEYMSPEQAQMSGWDIDTRSDIYALGVLLYELLTGGTPFDGKRLREAGLQEIQRIIREEQPHKPSTRLSTLDTLSSIAAHRSIEPRKLGLMIRGDLDWIIMRALEKDRTRRYETAAAFAADLGRFLANEPVIASPPSATYLARKFVRRHRAGVIAASAVAAAVLGGALIAALGYHSAVRSREIEAAAKRSEQTQRLLAQRSLEEATAQRRRAEDAAEDLRIATERERAAARRARRLAGIVLERTFSGLVARGVHGDDAVKVLEELLAQARSFFSDDPRMEAAFRAAAAEAYAVAGRNAAAADQLRAAIDGWRRAEAGADDPAVLSAQWRLASILFIEAPGEAQAVLERLVARYRAEGTDPPATAIVMLHRLRGEHGEAIELLRRALDELPPGDPRQLPDRLRLAHVLREAGRADEVPALWPGGLPELDRGSDEPPLLVAIQLRAELALAYRDAGRFVEAAPALVSAYDDLVRRFGAGDHRARAIASRLAELYDAWHRADPATAREEAAAWHDRARGSDDEQQSVPDPSGVRSSSPSSRSEGLLASLRIARNVWGPHTGCSLKKASSSSPEVRN